MESDDQEYVESGSGVMVSNLPLLFSRGSPSSLNEMSLVELEVFVPFMVGCSVGEERPVPWSQLPRPSWWPKKLPFRMPTANNTTAAQAALVGLVERCYTFHGCEYLLQFCASLVAQMPDSGYRFNDNRDGTTSMYHGSTGKLLVTFRNENRDYDKFSHDGRGRDSTKKLLLSPSAHTGERRGTNGTTAMFQPPATDIYLCDKCENEFYSLREVQNHEKRCRGDLPSSPVVPSPDPDLIDEEPEPAGQVPFLAYFNLQPAKHTGIEPYMSPRKRSTSSPPRKIPGPMYPRYDSIALSSPLGRFLFANSKFRNKYQASQHCIMRYERHLHATPHTDVNSSRERCNNRWIVVWRDRKEEQPWVHLYCFSSGQRRERRITINTGLDRNSRRLLRMCQPVKVRVKRLQKRLVDRIMRLGGPTAPCIDLTIENQMDPNWTHLGYPSMPVNNSLPDARAQFYGNENLLNYEASSSGRAFGTQQWEHSLQQQMTRNMCVPGGSGILTSGDVLSSSLTPKHTAQIGISELKQNAAIQQGSLKLIPLPSPRNQRISTNEQVILQSILSQKTQMGKVGNKNALGQSIYPCEGAVVPMKLNDTSPADISIIPLNSIAMHNSSNSQVNSDILKPLSRKKSNVGDCQSNVQGLTVREHCSNDSRVSVPVHTEAVNASAAYQQGQNKQITFNQGESVPKGNPNIYSHIVPHMSERESSTVPVNNASVTLSSISHTKTISCIEIIDLSSDDDDVVRARGQSEADNAPQQLDGLACYPHTGAKVPDSSDYSLPKNGNSHWSSKQKSHCGAGHVGDLATNGLPPNVPPNIATSPVPHVLFLPTTTVPPPASQGPETKGNSRKRKNEEPPSGGGKTLVLDISSAGVKISTNKSTREMSSPSKGCVSPKEDSPVAVIPEEVNPATPEQLNRVHFIPFTEVTYHEVSNRNGAHGNKKYTYENSSMFKVDEDISFKSPFHIDEDISFNIRSVKDRQTDYKKTEENSTPVKGMTDTKGKHLSAIRTPVGGLFSSIMNTVNKGVELFKSLVGSEGSWEPMLHSNGSLIPDKNALHKLHGEKSASGKSVQEKSIVRLQSRVDTLSALSSKGKNIKNEVKRLLKDECRELTFKGLGELRHLDLQDTRLTRKSVERLIPSRARRKSRSLLKYCKGVSPNDKYKVKTVNMSEIGATDRCNMGTTRESNIATTTTDLHLSGPSLARDLSFGCTDENGNSESNAKRVGEYMENCLNDAVMKKTSLGVFSENKIKNSETIVSEHVHYGKEHVKSRNGETPVVTYNRKPVQTIGSSETVERKKLVFGNKRTIADGNLKNVSKGDRKFYGVGTRELLNLAGDEWKEMRNRGFHPIKNIKPILSKAGHLENHLSRLDASSASIKTFLNVYQVEKLKKNGKKNKEMKLTREIKSLVQDEWKEMNRRGFHPSKHILPEIKRAVIRNTHYAINSSVGDKVVDEVDALPVAQTTASPEVMREPTEECGALQAQSPIPEEQQDRQTDELGKIPMFNSGRSAPMVSNNLEKFAAESNVAFKSGVGCGMSLESTIDPKALSKKKKRGSLIRELSNLGRDEYKELRGTGFHPADFVGSEKVEYLNASSDEEDGPFFPITNSRNPYSAREKNEILCTRGKKEKEKHLKERCECFNILSVNCRELKKRDFLRQSDSYIRRLEDEGGIRTQINNRSHRTTRSVLPTNINTSSAVSTQLCNTGGSAVKSMWCQMRNTRSQVNNGLSNIEVFTPRSSHRQILRLENAMCVLNYNIPNIN